MKRSRTFGYLILSVALGGAFVAFAGIRAADSPARGSRASVPKESRSARGPEVSKPAADSARRHDDSRPAEPNERNPAAKTWRRIQRQGFFTVSLDPDNLPYSAAKGELRGLEVELAVELGKQLDLTAKIDWINVQHETSLGKLLDGECDLVMGLPVDPRLQAGERSAGGRILYTRPYYRTGYLLFVRKSGPRIHRLKVLEGEETRRVGTQAGTVADFSLKQRGFRRKLYGTQRGALKALAELRIDYAYLWSNATWLARTSGEFEVEIVQPYELEDWRDMAAAVRRGDEEFRRQLDAALAQLVREKFIKGLLSRYGMPYYPAAEPEAKGADTDRRAPKKSSRSESHP